MENKRIVIKTIIYGVLSAALYFLLYLFAHDITELSKQGQWYFIVPVGIAFVFSIVHGNFTGYFWDLMGFKAKTKK
jgi:hypothetical protein